MRVIKNLKEKSRKLKSELQAVYYAYLHPGVGLLPKLIIVIALGYALSPIDLIPDFIPVIGLLDDLVIVPFFIALSIQLIPDDIMRECRRKAVKEPVSLRKNWPAAIFVIMIWLLILFFAVKAISGLLKWRK
jgi:uncharacterized membrane protein YkvA (DUF1232 family)